MKVRACNTLTTFALNVTTFLPAETLQFIDIRSDAVPAPIAAPGMALNAAPVAASPLDTGIIGSGAFVDASSS
jgi:hypothetical protein